MKSGLGPVLDSLDSPRMLLKDRVRGNPASIHTLMPDGSVEMNMQAPGSAIDYASMTNTFKVSHLVQPKNYKTSQRLLDLQKPKSVGLKTRRTLNIYDRSDFRGLLHADFSDTIKVAYSKRITTTTTSNDVDQTTLLPV